jgi:holo-[acyl-carrier protein] synthase
MQPNGDMIHFSTGIDLVKIDRIKRFLAEHENRWNKIFTPTEVDYCLKKKKNQFQHFAARFAAKEAILKALGIGLLMGFRLKDIEVVNDGRGRPKINLYGKVKRIAEKKCVREISISLSHSSEYAVAHALLVSDE